MVWADSLILLLLVLFSINKLPRCQNRNWRRTPQRNFCFCTIAFALVLFSIFSSWFTDSRTVARIWSGRTAPLASAPGLYWRHSTSCCWNFTVSVPVFVRVIFFANVAYVLADPAYSCYIAILSSSCSALSLLATALFASWIAASQIPSMNEVRMRLVRVSSEMPTLLAINSSITMFAKMLCNYSRALILLLLRSGLSQQSFELSASSLSLGALSSTGELPQLSLKFL